MSSRPPPATPSRIRLLIADDHPIVRAGLALVLAQETDFEVVGEAANGAEAISMARERKPDVILMDLRMPVMDGISAIAVITREVPNSRVLALTTFSGDADVRRALKAGARGYLLKDMLLTQVVGAVRSVHRGQRVLPDTVAHRLAEFPFEAELTPRETEVLNLVAQGLGNKEIAARLQRSDETVKAYLRNIFSKLGVDDRTAAVTTALARGLIQLAE